MFPPSSPPSRLAPLRMIGLALAAPLFLIVLLGALLAVVADFLCFRVHSVFTEDPGPKALWEL